MPERVVVREIKVEEARIPSVPIVRAIPPAINTPPPVFAGIVPPPIPNPSFTQPGFVPPVLPLQAPRTPVNPPPEENELDIEGVGEYAGSLNAPSLGGFSAEETKEVIEVFGSEIPVPKTDTVVLAGTTATASVAAALIGKSLVEALVKLMKPAVKQGVARVKKALGKSLTIEEAQLYFAFEQKFLRKRLKAEQRADLSRQRLHQRKPQHTENQDGK